MKLYAQFRTDSCKIIYPLWDKEDKNHTLFSSTSLYKPYTCEGVHPGGI